MPEGEAKVFRALAARANYLAADRLDIQFAAKEVCRDMAKPRRSSMTKMKRLARYLCRYRMGSGAFQSPRGGRRRNDRGLFGQRLGGVCENP